MNFALTYLTIGIIISLFVFIYVLQSKVKGSKFFAISCLLSILWMYAELVKRVNQDVQIQLKADNLRLFAVILLPAFLFLFFYEHFGKKLDRKKSFALFIVPLISIIVLFTNDYHKLFFREAYLNSQGYLTFEYGLYYWFVHVLYSYSLITATLVLSFLQLKKAPEKERKQIKILFISTCIPFAANVLAVFKVLGEVYLTAFALPIFFTIVAFAIFRYNFLKTNPIIYEKVLNSISDGVIIVDSDNKIVDINLTAAGIFGKTTKELVGSNLETAFSEIAQSFQEFKNAEDFNDEIQVNSKGERHFFSIKASAIKDKDETLEGRVFIIRDITEAKKYEFFLRNLAFQDALTHIANRRKFQQDFDLLIERSRVLKKSFAVIYFDIDDFKNINDSFGHNFGDELLKLIATRVASVLRGPDTVARIGGDEFAVLLHECSEDGAKKIVYRIRESIQKQPFVISKEALQISISAGIAVYPKDGLSMRELLEVADSRMYEEKNKKKDSETKIQCS